MFRITLLGIFPQLISVMIITYYVADEAQHNSLRTMQPECDSKADA